MNFRLFALVGLGICLASLGCSATNPIATESAANAARPVRVKAVALMQQEIQRTTTQPATVHPYHRVEIRARVSGYVTTLKVDIGDFVEKGAVLAEISVPEMEKQQQVMQARIAGLEAEEKRSSAGVELAKASVRSAEAKLAQSGAEASRADASLAALEAEFSRTSDLVQRQSLESRMLDEVRKRRDSDLANKQALQAAVQSAEAEVAVASARHLAAEADLQVAQTQTDIARRQLEELAILADFAILKAPLAGVITARGIEPGDLVRENSEVGRGQPLFVLSQVDLVRVHIPVPEVDAALVARGDAIQLSFPSFAAEQPLSATVTRLSGSLDPSTRTMLVEAEVKNTEGKLLPGMFGQATIMLGTKVAVHTLPARAIRFDETGRAFVYAIGEGDTVSVAQVATGIDDGNSIEILSGLEPGQRVIDAHLRRFADGDAVSILGR